MSLTLSEIEHELRQFSGAFEADLLDASSARTAVERAARIEKMAASVKGRAAARVAECGAHRARGERSPAHDLAALTGTTVGQAADELETAERLRALPEVERAARQGELSRQQASAIADALTAKPDADAARLLECARRGSLSELRDECERTKAAGDDGAEPDAGASTTPGPCAAHATPTAPRA